MTVLQLIRGGDHRLEPLPNPDHLKPAQIFRQGKDTFFAGSDDLIFIAFHLKRHGFRLMEFYFVDRFFAPIDAVEKEWLSDLLVRVIDSGTDHDLRKFIDSAMKARFVEQVRLLNEVTGNNIYIAQQGVITANDEDIAFLRKALSKFG